MVSVENCSNYVCPNRKYQSICLVKKIVQVGFDSQVETIEWSKDNPEQSQKFSLFNKINGKWKYHILYNIKYKLQYSIFVSFNINFSIIDLTINIKHYV